FGAGSGERCGDGLDCSTLKARETGQTLPGSVCQARRGQRIAFGALTRGTRLVQRALNCPKLLVFDDCKSRGMRCAGR